jgi:hypothetical protein
MRLLEGKGQNPKQARGVRFTPSPGWQHLGNGGWFHWGYKVSVDLATFAAIDASNFGRMFELLRRGEPITEREIRALMKPQDRKRGVVAEATRRRVVVVK